MVTSTRAERIRDIVPILPVAMRYQDRLHLTGQGREYVGRCPFHDDRGRPNFYVVPHENFYYCFVCRAWGDAADLVSQMEGLTPAQARRKVLSERSAMPLAEPVQPPKQPWPADRRDLVYRRMLGLLTLSDEDHDALLDRGLSREAVEANGYRTLPPPADREPVISTLAQEFGDLSGLPGLYRDGVAWKLSGLSGLLTPVRDPEGRILGLQVRASVHGTRTYSWLSSQGREGGTSPGALPHVARPVGPTKSEDAALVTEGPLKADVTADRLGLRVVAVPGFALWRRALEPLRTLGAARVAIAFDQDREAVTAMLVGQAVRELADALEETGTRVFAAHWPTSKGIDDALVAGERIEYTPL